MAGGGRSGGVAVLLVGAVVWVGMSRAGAPQGSVLRAGPAQAAVARVDARRGAPLQAGSLQVALESIDGCLPRLNPDVDVGYDRVVARCPVLVRRLEENGFSAWLPHDWRRPGNDLSAGGLRELRSLLSHELAGNAGDEAVRAPSVERVHAVLASLAGGDDERSGWWARTKAWLRGVFARGEPATDEGWLARMVGQSGLSQTVIELISYVALGLVVVLAVVIAVNELCVSGVFGGLRRRFAVLADVPIASGRAAVTWDDVQRAPPLQRPGLLLELLIATLAESSRLRSTRGLTVRELTRAARLADEEDRERLMELARTSERVRFSKVEVSGSEIAAAVESGRVLLEKIASRPDGGVRGGGLPGGGIGGDGALGGSHGVPGGGP
jgi:hypothetical protein